MAKIGRNDPCPCGSGKEFKRCCLGKGLSTSGFRQQERWSALEKLEQFVILQMKEEEMTPLLHDAWISCILNPPTPRMTNTDGEDIVETSVRFAVDDSVCLEAAFDGAKAIERTLEDKSTWIWTGNNQKEKPVTLGQLILKGKTLTLTCNSTQRAERGRHMLEAMAAGAVRYRTTVHENIDQRIGIR